MYIEDDELRELYKASSSEHVQKLETDLMILEKNPQDTAAIEEFLREAHTLKGDSRMLGLDDIEMLVHHLESSMEEIKAGDTSITPELCDRLYLGIDAINQLAHQAITGETVAINTVEVLASLMGSSEAADSGDLFADDAESELFEDDLFGDEPSFSPSDSEETFSEAGLFDDEPLIEQPAVASIAPPEPEVLPTAKAGRGWYQFDSPD
ncbi:MAG: Hpt domain-containing protein [Cyanobacteria bacterium J06558_2]